MKKGFIQVLFLILLIIVSVAFAYYYGTQQKGKSDNFSVSQETDNPKEVKETVSFTPTPSFAPTSNIPSGWGNLQ